MTEAKNEYLRGVSRNLELFARLVVEEFGEKGMALLLLYVNCDTKKKVLLGQHLYERLERLEHKMWRILDKPERYPKYKELT